MREASSHFHPSHHWGVPWDTSNCASPVPSPPHVSPGVGTSRLLFLALQRCALRQWHRILQLLLAANLLKQAARIAVGLPHPWRPVIRSLPGSGLHQAISGNPIRWAEGAQATSWIQAPHVTARNQILASPLMARRAKNHLWLQIPISGWVGSRVSDQLVGETRASAKPGSGAPATQDPSAGTDPPPTGGQTHRHPHTSTAAPVRPLHPTGASTALSQTCDEEAEGRATRSPQPGLPTALCKCWALGSEIWAPRAQHQLTQAGWGHHGCHLIPLQQGCPELALVSRLSR